MFGGFSLAPAFDPLSVNKNSVLRQAPPLLATALLFATNAHLLVIGGLLRDLRCCRSALASQPASIAEVVTTGVS